MPNTTTVIVGAGHCGLAMSRCLAARSIDHVVLERGEVANSWRTQRWDSLRLLTPNWMTRLPGYAYRGADPDGYLSARQVTAMLADYANASAAPVLTGTTVTSVRAAGGGYVVRTDQGTWRAPTVVLACGAATVPAVPALARLVPDGITSVTPAGYRNPGELPGGGVLVVGASASGVQLADELHRSGRPVTLAVGEHVRMPRTYRGRDILWWLDAAGVLDERYDEVDDLVRARNVAVHAAGRLAGPDGRPERVELGRGAAGRPPGRDRRRGRPVLRLAAQRVRAGRPEAGAAAEHDRRLGGDGSVSGSRRRSCAPRRWAWTCGPGEIARSSGRPATGPICPGSTSRCSTAGAGSSTTAA